MRRIHALVALPLTSVLLASCSLVGDDDDGKAADGTDVVLVTHDSFVMSDELVAQFEEETGYRLKVKAAGDAGQLTNKLVLTKGDPTGDVVFGIDNTFGSRAIDEGVLAPYAADLPDGVADFALPGDDQHELTPVDTGNVCVNVDTTYFGEGTPPPASLEDLTKPAYQDLFVTPGATTSSPGLAFLLATVAEYGDEWPDYWTRLLANGAEVTEGWTDAYEVEFTQGGGGGDRPIVLSYDSSPAFALDDSGDTSTTRALLDTCFRQVEYAGVLAGAANPEGAEALVDFMLGSDFQAALPEAMYVFPVAAGTPLPPEWAEFAKQPETAYSVDPAEVDESRDAWLTEWSDLVSR